MVVEVEGGGWWCFKRGGLERDPCYTHIPLISLVMLVDCVYACVSMAGEG